MSVHGERFLDFLTPEKITGFSNGEFVEQLRRMGFASPKQGAAAFCAMFQASWLGSALDRIEELEEDIKKLRELEKKRSERLKS